MCIILDHYGAEEFIYYNPYIQFIARMAMPIEVVYWIYYLSDLGPFAKCLTILTYGHFHTGSKVIFWKLSISAGNYLWKERLATNGHNIPMIMFPSSLSTELHWIHIMRSDISASIQKLRYLEMHVIVIAESNHIHYKVWDEITYPFLNFNGATVEV